MYKRNYFKLDEEPTASGTGDPAPEPNQVKPPEVNTDMVKEEMLRYKQQAESASKEKAELESKLALLEENKLKEKENFKELWEREKNRAEEAVTKVKNIETSYLNDKKVSAIQSEAHKAGIDPNYMDFLVNTDSNLVAIETTSTGNVNVLGVSEFIEDFKVKYPAMFKSGKGPNINSNQPGDTFNKKEYTSSELLELSRKDPKKYKELMLKKINS